MRTADARAVRADAVLRSPSPRGPNARHRQAIANTLCWADEAAQRGDPVGALMWIEVIRAMGDELPDAYERKRGQWELALRRAQVTPPAEADRSASRETAS